MYASLKNKDNKLPRQEKKQSIAYVCLLFNHPKVEFILISIRCLLLQPLDAFLFRVVVSCTQHIVLVFFKKTKSRAMCELRALLMVPAMQGIAKRRHGCRSVQNNGDRNFLAPKFRILVTGEDV